VLREALEERVPVDCIFFTEEGEAILSIYLDILRERRIEALRVSEQVFSTLASTTNPQGVLAVVGLLHREPQELLAQEREPQVLVCQVRDPGNLGAIIRAADAAAAGAVVISADSVDLYNPKTVRATAGSLFHLPIAVGVEMASYIASLQSRGFRVIGSSPIAPVPIWDADLTGPVALMVGNEAWGVPATEAGAADLQVRIPILGKAESLNVAEATSVMLYELVRQRQVTGGGEG
jgi:TrmH family RNA methyltransferase